MLVTHDDGSTELVTVPDTSQPNITSYQDMATGGSPLQIETLPNTPSPTSSPPPVERSEDSLASISSPVERSEDSLEDRESRSPHHTHTGTTGQSGSDKRGVERGIGQDKLRNLNCHLEMSHLTPGDLLTDKVTVLPQSLIEKVF